MSRCQICNYCEATGSPSQYESTEAVHMNVQFRKGAGQDLCDACWEGIKLNRNTYRFEQMEKGGQIEFDWNARDVEETDDDPPWEDIDPEEMERNTPALSEV